MIVLRNKLCDEIGLSYFNQEIIRRWEGSLLKFFYICQTMSNGKVILPKERFDLTVRRLCLELIEKYQDFTDTCMIGIQSRGTIFSDRVMKVLHEIDPTLSFPYGKIDITFHRDDFRIREKPLKASTTDIDFLVDGQRVILVDDVLYSGRTVQAAMSALQHFGRPKEVELLTLIDRRFNRQLPINADYVGLQVDALDRAYVKVTWEEIDGKDEVLLFSEKDSIEQV